MRRVSSTDAAHDAMVDAWFARVRCGERVALVVATNDDADAISEAIQQRRGREEFRKYRECDYIFASYGKSGRTWVRVMISRYFQLVYNLPDNILMGFDNYTRLDSRIPKIFFTHDNYLREFTGNTDSKRD